MRDLFIPFDPDSRSLHILDCPPLARYEVVAPRKRRPAMLRVNYYAAALLDSALQAGNVFIGTVLRPEILGIIPNRLTAFAFHCKNDADYLAVIAFRNAFNDVKHLSSDGYVIVYRADRIDSIQDVRIISQHLREELTHWQQNFFGLQGTEGHVIAKDVAQHPYWDLIKSHLLDLRYTDNLDLLVAEAGAKLAAGSHADLGLTADQGAEFLAHYYLQLLKLHGFEKANQILQFVDRTEVLRLHAIGKTYVSSAK